MPKIAVAVAQVPGYPANADLIPAGPTAAMTALASHNTTVAVALIGAQEAINDRHALYESSETRMREYVKTFMSEYI
jgi:hypothetical protein